MCKHGHVSMVRLNRPREISGRLEVPVDTCIADEIQKLNDNGVWTLGCCCGHYETKKTILIDQSSASIAKKLGYNVELYSEGILNIY